MSLDTPKTKYEPSHVLSEHTYAMFMWAVWQSLLYRLRVRMEENEVKIAITSY